MDGMASVKIAINIAVDELTEVDPALINPVIERYLQVSQDRMEDPEAELLDIQAPRAESGSSDLGGSPLLALVAPVMGGMLIFYAFNTGASTAQTILREEEAPHPAAIVHHPHTPGRYPEWQILVGLPDCVGAGDHPAAGFQTVVWNSLGNWVGTHPGSPWNCPDGFFLRYLYQLLPSIHPPRRCGLWWSADCHEYARDDQHVRHQLTSWPAHERYGLAAGSARLGGACHAPGAARPACRSCFTHFSGAAGLEHSLLSHRRLAFQPALPVAGSHDPNLRYCPKRHYSARPRTGAFPVLAYHAAGLHDAFRFCFRRLWRRFGCPPSNWDY